MDISKETKEKIKKGEILDVHEVEETLEILDTYENLNNVPIVSFFQVGGEWYSLEHGGDIRYPGADVTWKQKAKKHEKAPEGFGL